MSRGLTEERASQHDLGACDTEILDEKEVDKNLAYRKFYLEQPVGELARSQAGRSGVLQKSAQTRHGACTTPEPYATTVAWMWAP